MKPDYLWSWASRLRPLHHHSKIAVSFSGGRSSAIMSKLVLMRYGHSHDIEVTFANTGQEHWKTLEFVWACEEWFGKQVTWIEAAVDPAHGVGIRHAIVDYMTASRDGSPYEAYIAKYGIPGPAHPQCTSRLKIEPMESYLRSRGFLRGKRSNYYTSIGIRSDEIDRMSDTRDKQLLIYPLVDAGVTKSDVETFWRDMPFSLDLPEHLGNCTWCWKKTDRKLYTLAVDYPEVFAFPARMEKLYGSVKANNDHGVRRFFRKNRSTFDIIDAASQPFVKWGESTVYDPTMDVGGACGESCEIGADITGADLTDTEE